jgi:hypothetical protein
MALVPRGLMQEGITQLHSASTQAGQVKHACVTMHPLVGGHGARKRLHIGHLQWSPPTHRSLQAQDCRGLHARQQGAMLQASSAFALAVVAGKGPLLPRYSQGYAYYQSSIKNVRETPTPPTTHTHTRRHAATTAARYER